MASKSRRSPPAPTPAPPPAGCLAVTGSHTYVGRRILGALDRLAGFDRVVVMDVIPPDVADPRVTFHQVDLTRPGIDLEMADLMKDRGVTAVLHAAFLSDAVRDAGWAHELQSVGTDYVLAAVVAAGVRKLVMASSVAVYGASHRAQLPLGEDAPLLAAHSLPPFGDRVAAEQAVARFAAAHPEVCTTVLRPAIALGCDVGRIIPRALGRRVVPVLAGFDPLVQFLHPDDLAEGFVRCLVEDHPGVFNLAPDDVLPLSEVLRIGDRIALPIPHVLAFPGWGVLWTAGIGDTHPAYLKLLRFPLVADGRRAREAWGFAPRPTVETVRTFYAGVGR